jgi:C-terminal processing protease CtpA/Prc
LLGLLGLISAGRAATNESTETSRLITAARIWATVRFFHPDSAGGGLAWDRAVAAALFKIRTADSEATFQAAVNDLLQGLHDPQTFVLAEHKPGDDLPISVEQVGDGALVIAEKENPPSSLSEAELLRSIQSSPKIIFDLRGSPARNCRLAEVLDRPEFSRQLTRVAISAAEKRNRVHNGWTPENSRPKSSFQSAYYSSAGEQISPDPNASEHKFVFLVNEHGALPVVGSALWESGRASVIAESANFRYAASHSVSLPLGSEAMAYVRISDPAVRLSPLAASRSEVMAKAMALLQGPVPERPAHDGTWPLSSVTQSDETEGQSSYPDEPYRILAAFKTWAVIHYFYAYRDLMDEDWDERFAEFLPKFIDAKDAREYNLAIAEAITHLADSQAVLQSEELANYFGRAPVGLRLRLIEKRPMVTEILDPEARAAGVQVGDIVAKVDGENIVERIKREAGTISASTQQSLSELAIRRILYGPEGSLASLSIGGQDGRTREINLKRSASYEPALQKQRTGEVWKRLSGDIGYIDLDRLRNEDIDPALQQLDPSKSLILDARGTAQDSAARLAARLSSRSDATPAALITTPLVLAPDLPQGDISTRSASSFFVRTLPPRENPGFKGKLVVLIDGRTAGPSEEAGLFFEAANKAEFIGSPSAGAIGETSNFVLPGGVTVTFSGQDVRHANGGQLQRLGFQPNVTVSPTVEGIRKGRDEVLEKAVEYLSR